MSEDHKPEVEEAYRAKMNAVADALDLFFNGEKGERRKVGFTLLVFEFGISVPGAEKRMNYISNTDREDMLCALKEIVAKFEGRAPDAAGHA